VIADDGTMPAKNIGERQPLDRLLNALDEKTRKNLQTMLTGTSDALDGRGEDLNAAFGDLDPATAELTKLVTILEHQRGSVRSLVKDSATVLNVVSARDSDLAGLVNNGKAVLAETAQRNQAVTDTIKALPALTRQLRSTGVALDRTALIANPTLKALRPAAKYGPHALRQLSKLAPRATTLFREFNRLVPSARAALPAVAAITNAVTPFAESLYPLARELVPVINFISAVDENVMGSMATTGAALNNRPLASNGQPTSQLRVIIPITEEGLTGDTERQGISRHNAYYGPGALNAVGRQGLAASDCDNVNNPNKAIVVGTGNIPCKVDPGWVFGGVRRYYPHLERLPPAK
jgi:ABC-type transporter Mla subunit MlaD